MVAIGAAGLSGCLGSLAGDDSAAGFERWLVDPGSEVDEYRAITTSRADLEPVSDRLSRDFWRGYRRDHLDPVVGEVVDEFDRTVSVTARGEAVLGFTGVAGEFDAERVGAELESLGFDRGDDHEGYRLYDPEGSGLFAVRDDAVLRVPPRDHDVGPETVLDGIERSDAYTDVDPEFDRLLSTVPDGQIRHATLFEPVDEFDARRAQLEGTYATGTSLDIGPDETRDTWVYFVSDEDLVSEADVQAILDRHYESDVRSTATYDIDGDVVTFEATIPTEDLG